MAAATSEKVSVGPKNIPAYVQGSADAPSIVVIQEWWGVTDELKAQAAKIAETLKVRVLIPDLYKGKLGVEVEEAHHLMDNLDWPTAKDELTACVQYLKSNGQKVGVVGFCMGGALALIAAQHSSVDAAICFYGSPQEEICQVEKIKVPVLLMFGEKDGMEGFAQPAQAKALNEKIQGSELHIFPGVGHAFMNGLSSEAPSMQEKIGWGGVGAKPDNLEEVQQEAWQRTLAFFTKHIVA